MIENKEQFAATFIPYLREFLVRARAEKPDLTQVQVPPELQSAANQLGLSFKTSFGMGTATVIPWLACFLPGQTAGKEGVYPVLLYRRDTNTSSVCYGVSATAQAADGNWPRSWPDALVSQLPHFGHQKYQQSYELRLFSATELDQYSAIVDAFIKVINDYLQVPRTMPSNLVPFFQQEADLSTLVPSSVNDISVAGLNLQGGILGRLAASLLTKRFLILTGLSGSGKTKLAHAFAAWIGESDAQYRVVAVGADWTTNENLLGYQDALRPEVYRKPNNGALELMLRARDDVIWPPENGHHEVCYFDIVEYV